MSSSPSVTPLIDERTELVDVVSKAVDSRMLLAVQPPLSALPQAERREAEDLWLFVAAPDALQAALELQGSGRHAIAIHPSECTSSSHGPRPLDSNVALVRALLSAAAPGQILVSEDAYADLADALPRDATWVDALAWRAHGRYQFEGQIEPVSVVEVSSENSRSTSAPSESGRLSRLPNEGLIPGWRAAIGQEVPQRPGWRLARRLGVGGFGEAWLGIHATNGEQRVFKFCYHETRLISLKREVALFRLLQQRGQDHPGILPLIDWHLDTPPHFLESPHVAGGDLRQWCASRGGVAAIPLAERLQIAAQMAEALAAAHAVGVLHKDIKPSNVLMDARDGKMLVRLADFGIGAITDELRADAAQMTVAGGGSRSALFNYSGMFGGTPKYMAPELFEGSPSTIQADVFAFGVVLFQLATGDFNRALSATWQDEISSPPLRANIASLTAREPAQRRTDLVALATELRNLDQREAALAEAQREAAKAERARRLRRWLVPAFVGVLVLALVLAGMLRKISDEAARANAEAIRANAEASRANLEAERANREAATASEVTEFFVDLFKIANPDESRGAAVTVREVLDKGAERVDEELAGQPRVRARLLHVIGNVYRQLGLLSAATPMAERGVAVLREEKDPGADLARALNQLAAMVGDSGKFEQAVPLLEESLALMEKEGLQDDDHYGDALSILGSIYNDMGERELAGPVLERTVAWREKHLPPGDSSIAIALNNYGFHRLQIGDYRGSTDLFERSLVIRRQALGEEHSETAISWNNLSAVYRLRGDLDRAEEAAKRASTIWETTLGDKHTFTSVGWHNLCVMARLRGKWAEARDYASRALVIRRASYGEDHPWVANTMSEVAQANSALGNHADAETGQRHALALRLKRDGAEGKDVALSRIVLSEILLAAGKQADALSEASAGAASLRRLAQASPEDRVLRQEFVAGLFQWGWSLASTGDRDAAVPIWREAFKTLEGVEGEDRLIRVVQLRARLHAALGEQQSALRLRRELDDAGFVDPLLAALTAAP
ncbi:MAG: tetratricopeptide repeat protein [Pseudomarimonas sp.]